MDNPETHAPVGTRHIMKSKKRIKCTTQKTKIWTTSKQEGWGRWTKPKQQCTNPGAREE